jgi:hypothetical protein
MGLSPIASIREVDKASSTRADREVAPPFALDRSGRMEDDVYNEHSEDAERGLEEDAEQTDEANESAETSETPLDQGKTVDLVA